MAHIANLKNRAAALGLTIVKQSSAKDSTGSGFNEYTLAANELDHGNSYMFSLDGIAHLIQACESFPAASPDQIKAILEHDNPLKYAGELLRIHKQDQEAMRSDIQVGDSVSFSSLSDATWFEVVAINGDDMHVKREGEQIYLSGRPADRKAVLQLRKAKFPPSATIDCPFNGAIKAAVNDGARSTAKRISMERDICFALVRAAIEAGFNIAVYDGEECTIKSSDDFVTVAKALFTTDENYIEFRKGSEYIGAVTLIYGNDGFDVVSDYNATQSNWHMMKAFMLPIETLADSLEKEDSFDDAAQRLLKAHNESFVDRGVSAMLDGSGETVESVVIPECGVASEKDREPHDLMVKRAPSYPEAVLKRVVTAAIASGEKPVENIPAEPAKPYDSAIGTYTTPYGEGQEAFKAGKRWNENPYPGGSVESYQWDRGHTSVRCPELATANPVHSHDLLCEAALCIWENMLEIRHGKPSLDETWDKFGTVAMRHAAIALAPAACSIWDMMSEDEQQSCIPYDWEFIPAFVSLVNWDDWIDFGTSALAGGVDLESVKTAILATFQKPES